MNVAFVLVVFGGYFICKVKCCRLFMFYSGFIVIVGAVVIVMLVR